MDGRFAVLTLALGAFDIHMSGCTETCLDRRPDDARLNLSIGQVYFRERKIGEEVYLRYDLPHADGPWQNIAGLSVTDQGSVWFGLGHAYRDQLWPDSHFYGEVHAMTGLYNQGQGIDLGWPIEFRSGFELGYEWDSGWRAGIGFDHRSNLGFGDVNPGLETLHFRVAAPISK